MKKDSLSVIPLQPGCAVKNDLGNPNQNPTPTIPPSVHIPDVDFLMLLVKGHDLRCYVRLFRVARIGFHAVLIIIKIALPGFYDIHGKTILIRIRYLINRMPIEKRGG
jgi:hypothetical protein